MGDPGLGNSADETTVASGELPDHLLAKLRVKVPGYELLDQIGVGGQATVYRARELTSGLTVAIKVLNGGPWADANARERLHRETAALRALNHPNIVCVIDAGRTPMGLDYLVMNYVDGRPLDALWSDRVFAARIAPEPPARLRLFKRICDTVQSAHLKGITHRDLSPSNILITPDGEPHVLDFGLASTAFNELLSPSGRAVSVTGEFLGKVKYAAPEQARGGGGGRDAVDIRTDVYALGVILYQILTNGAFPYEVVGNLVDVLNHIIHTEPRPPSTVVAQRGEASRGRRLRPDPPLVNPAIEAIVLKALAKRPSERYQSAGELGADIDLYLSGKPTTAAPGAAAAASASTASAPRAARGRFGRRSLIISVTSLVLITGVLMNARVILNFLGLTGLAAMLGAAPATRPADAVALSSRQQNLLMQLADAEANIQAINRALVLTGYKVGQAYDKIDSSAKGNELMNRKGGGPVRWDEFYGKTAKDYGRLSTAPNGYWGDRRPQQFDFIYKANNDQAARAQQQIANLAKDQAGLLARRQKHEADQARLWATIAFEAVEDREIGFEPHCRYKLKGNGGTADAKVELARAFVLFLRSADVAGNAAQDTIETDPSATLNAMGGYMGSAYKSVQDALAKAGPGDAVRKQSDALKGLCKQLSEECAVVAENHRNALERDRDKEDNSKLAFRAQLQASLARFASETAELDEQVAQALKGWEVVAEEGVESTDKPVAWPLKGKGGGAGDVAAARVMPVGSAWEGHARGLAGKDRFEHKITARVTAVEGDRVTLRVTNPNQTRDLIMTVGGDGAVKVVDSPVSTVKALNAKAPVGEWTDIKLMGTVTGQRLSFTGSFVANKAKPIAITYTLRRE